MQAKEHVTPPFLLAENTPHQPITKSYGNARDLVADEGCGRDGGERETLLLLVMASFES